MRTRIRLSSGVSAVVLSAAVLLAWPVLAMGPQGTQSPPATGQAKPPVKAGEKAPPAAKAPNGLPAARTIIDRHIQAIGGRKAILAHQSSRIAGTVTVTGNGMSGNFEIFAMKPD